MGMLIVQFCDQYVYWGEKNKRKTPKVITTQGVSSQNKLGEYKSL